MKNKKKQVLIIPAPGTLDKTKKHFPEVELVRGKLKDIEFRFNHNLIILHKGKDIKTFDFVWLSSVFNSRAMSKAMSIYLDYYEVPHTKINYGEGTSKLVDLTHFELNNLPIPQTFFQKKQKLEDKVDVVAEFCGFPLIIKDTRGCQGKNSFLVNSKKELLEILRGLPKHKNFVFQQFIPNEFDWGVLVAQGNVVSAERSFRKKGEFRNNACQGAKEVFEDTDNVSEEVKQIAKRACNILNLEWARADIVVNKDTKKPYLLEVNRFPGITLGSTEEKAFHNYLKSKLSN